MAERDLAGFIVNAPSNVRYLTGYTGSNGIVCLGTAPRFMTDFRYATSVTELAADWEVEIVQQSLLGDVAKRIPELFGAERIGFEAAALSYSAWQALDEAARAAGAELVPCEQVVEDLRAVKDADEIALIRAGGELCDAIYAWLADEGSWVARSARSAGRSSGAHASWAPRAPRSRRSSPRAPTARCRTPCPARSRSSARRSWCSISARSSTATAPTARARSRPARASRR